MAANDYILPASSFDSFPALPTELRLKIWGYALRVQRVIELQYCLMDRQLFTFQHVPALLHTNKESREAGLSHYHLSFGTDKNPPATYFNNAYDIVYFGSGQYSDEVWEMIQHFRKASEHLVPREKIRNLALAQHLWTREDSWNPFSLRKGPRSIRHFHQAFPGLEKLVFVNSKGCPSTDDEDDQAEVARRDYSGILLFDSESGLSLLADSGLALKAVMLFFEAEKQNGTLRVPDVVVMEHELKISFEDVQSNLYTSD